MAMLTISTGDLNGVIDPDTSFEIFLHRAGDNSADMIHDDVAIVSTLEYSGTTDANGEAQVSLKGSSSFRVSTYYEIKVGRRSGIFTMPDVDAHLIDLLGREAVSPGTAPPTGGGDGFTRAQIEAIVRAGVRDWAETSNTDTIPDNKIPGTIARDTEVPTNDEIDARARIVVGSGVQEWAKSANTDPLPDSKIPDGITRDSELPDVSEFQTQDQVDARVRAGVENFAETGNAALIPDSKIPDGITRDSELPDVSEFQTEAEVDARVAAGVQDWAEDGNTDIIPSAKLPPASSSGLTQAEVDARVQAGVQDWAEDGNRDTIPDSKIPDGITRDSELPDITGLQNQAQVDARVEAGVQDWAEDGNTDTIPDSKIPSTITRDSELPDITGLQNQAQVDARIRNRVENFAEVGNTTQIPDGKIPSTITRDSELPDITGFLSQAEVDARIETWAREGNTDLIPSDKLPEGTGGGGGGGGIATTLLGSGVVDFITNSRWANEANTPDITLDDSPWFLVALQPRGTQLQYSWINGDEWRGLTAGVYGGSVLSGAYIITPSYDFTGNSRRARWGRTADNKILVELNDFDEDPQTLRIYSVAAASGGGGGDGSVVQDWAEEGNTDTIPDAKIPDEIARDSEIVRNFVGLGDTQNVPGSPGQALIWNATGDVIVSADRGEAGVVSLEAGVSDLTIGPMRQTTLGTVPDDTAALPNTTEFNLEIATSGRTLDSGVSISSDNRTINILEGGVYLVQTDVHGLASTHATLQIDPSPSGVFRPEGQILIYRNGNVVGRISLSYARYARWQTDGNGNVAVSTNTGDTIHLVVQMRRVESSIQSINWSGHVNLEQLKIVGSAAPSEGIQSTDLDNAFALTQAQYDALVSPSARNVYFVRS